VRNGSKTSEKRGVKGTIGQYLARSDRAKIRPYFLYSVIRDFASSAWDEVRFQEKNAMKFIWEVSRCLFFLLVSTSLMISTAVSQTPQADQKLELSRTVRTWEFLPVVGTQAGLFGTEDGRFEAWVYPLKIVRDFHLIFHVGDRALPAETLARTLTVRPESASILYAGDSFRVRETLCVPVNEAGAVIVLDIETEQPLEVEAAFTADFQLEWPAALGGTFTDWDAKQHAFVFGEESRKFGALLGSPTAGEAREAYETNYSSSEESSLRLGVTQRGKDTKALVIAASVNGIADAEKTYQHLLDSYADAVRESADYYRSYLAKTVTLELPDTSLQQAYDWARISTIQGLVNNPYLGSGLVAGYRTSGVGQRPGFAWFFGRDSLWTSFALNAEGDYATSRAAIDFIAKYQREDGKVPHEISQSASLVPWFKDYPYPYVSADATPLLILAVNDYVAQSGDLEFARNKWDNVWRAYQFLKSTYDSQGLAQNAGVGHGWVEGGPLLPVRNEYYQAGLGVAALGALSNLAVMLGKEDVSNQVATEFDHAKTALDSAFWSKEKSSYIFGVKADNQQMDEATVLTTVPMWFGVPGEDRADQTITQIAAADHETDWGMRIISQQSKIYDGSGYHYGSVWPLFTGWASVGEYRYHRAQPAYFNLRSNALLFMDGALGHFSEVLSGDYNQSFSTSSPHQIWSAAMVISPILRGMFGLATDAEKKQITLAPHVPADWTSFAVRNVRTGEAGADFQYRKTPDGVVLEVKRNGSGECWVEFSPAFSLRTEVVGAEMNGRPIPFKVQANSNDKHVNLRFPVYSGPNNVVIRVKHDFGLSYANELPALGSASRGLRVISEAWTAGRDQLSLQVSGLAGMGYEMNLWNPNQVSRAEGATLTNAGKLEIRMPAGAADTYVEQKVVLHFAP
jgi:glycogen debranching enzyme